LRWLNRRWKLHVPDDFSGAVPVPDTAAGRRVNEGLTFSVNAGSVDTFKVDWALGLTRAVLRPGTSLGTIRDVTPENVQHAGDYSIRALTYNSLCIVKFAKLLILMEI
jgi:hypothetical protein